MATEKFWIVWTPGKSNPGVVHRTQPEAIDEALRLASECPGEFYVCEIVGVARRLRAEYECIH